MSTNKQRAIQELLKLNIKNHDQLTAVKRKMSKKYGIDILLNSDILEKISIRTRRGAHLQRLLRKRSIRTLSGIAPVAVLTKPYPCPGKCAYCPTEPNVPQSYLSNEPAVMRAIRCNYNPYKQVQSRLKALEANGHNPTKIEIIVIGGTWSVLPKKYKYWFISECFRAANEYNKNALHSSPPQLNPAILRGRKGSFIPPLWREGWCCPDFKTTPNPSLLKEGKTSKTVNRLIAQQKKNETTKYKIIGLTLETRPDYINDQELLEMRELGCTRVELGVQAIDNKILKLNKRGHGVEEIVQATRLLKDYGFKVTYHFMPGLPGSTAKKDYQMFSQLFSDECFQPDQIKFYPTIVTKGSLLYRWWKAGKYKPYSNKVLENLIIKCKSIVPKYVRIIRLIRDIPGESIIAGNRITNLRQVLKDKGVKCSCIRCREARDYRPPRFAVRGRGFKISDCRLQTIKYQASGGTEYFISYESKDKKILYGFCRLRLPAKATRSLLKESGCSTALIRELHVYGELVPIGKKKIIQHAGLGKKLMTEAEKIARENNYKKISVISGIGVRTYYRKLGYKLSKTYMIKSLT